MASPRSSGLPPEEIVARIKKALARDKTHTWEHVCDLLQVGAVQIFWNEHGAWITEVRHTPIAKWCHVWVVAGELPGVMDLQEKVIDFARQEGCQQITATARFGWKHVAKAHGWENHAVLIRHDV
jgi:hypothetical protein